MPVAHAARAAWRLLAADPRHGQIAVLASLLAYGLARLDFDLSPWQIAVTVGTALAVQWLGDTWA